MTALELQTFLNRVKQAREWEQVGVPNANVEDPSPSPSMPIPIRNAPPVTVSSPLPSTQYPNVQAERLEQEAQPQRVQPQGLKENVIAGIVGALTPGGYSRMMLQEGQLERQRQQDLFARAKEFRQEGFQQQQLFQQGQNQNLQLEETKRLRDIEERRANSEEALQKAQIGEMGRKAKEPIKLTPGETLAPQGTGETTTFTAPNRPLTTAPPTTQTDQGVMQWNPQTQRYDIRAGGLPHPPKGPIDSASLNSIINGIQNGDITRETLSSMVSREDAPEVMAELQRRNIPLLSKTQQTDVRNLDALSGSIDSIEELSKRVHTSTEGFRARAGGLIKKGEAALGYNDDARQMMVERLRAVQLVRAIGERGRIPTQQVAMGELMLGLNPGLTKSEAELTIKRMRELIASSRKALLEPVGSPESGSNRIIDLERGPDGKLRIKQGR